MEVEMVMGEEGGHMDSEGVEGGQGSLEGGLARNHGAVEMDPHVSVGGPHAAGSGSFALETRPGEFGGGGPLTTPLDLTCNISSATQVTDASQVSVAITGHPVLHDAVMTAPNTPITASNIVQMVHFGGGLDTFSAGVSAGTGEQPDWPDSNLGSAREPTNSGFPTKDTQDVYNLGGHSNTSPLDNMAFALSPSLLFPPSNQAVALPQAVPPSTHPTPSLLNSAPPPLPTRRTQWMPDFTFGPSSELIDIKEFLKGAQGALGRSATGQAGPNVAGEGGSGQTKENHWIRPEGVAGWNELQALGAEEQKALEGECSVSDLLASLTDITSDPAQINLVKEIHNRSTLAALGHTVESIKLPLEKRDRKRKRGGKVGGLGDKSGDDHADGGQGCGDESAQEGHARDEPQGQISENCGQRAISPPATTPESRSGGPPAPATRGSRIRKAKSRPEPQETTSDPVLLELGNTLGTLKLRSWSLTNAAKHYIRKPRSSDVNVLTEVRPSTIPFTLPDEPNSRPQSLSPNNSDLQGSTEYRSAHALVQLAILTPAPHPPHTPRHTLSLALLNSQTLEDISEALVCPNRWIPRSINDSGVPSGACIVVEGTVYGDGEGDAAGKDYADKVTEYLAALKAQASAPTNLGKKERDAIMILDEQLEIGLPMLSTRLDSVRWKLHKPYWFMHDGGCVHWVVVYSISLLHPHDPPLPTAEKASNWPYVTSLSPLPHRALCRVCSRVPAVLAVSGDSRLGESPSLVCNGCWTLLGPPKVGRDYLEGVGGFTALSLVSPDGL